MVGNAIHCINASYWCMSLVLIHWKVIYLVDSPIHPLNIEPAPEKDTEAVKSFNNTMDIQGEVGFERIVRSLHILNPSALL